MDPIREKARDKLKTIAAEVRSNIPGSNPPANNPEFTRLTKGMTHTELQTQWESTKKTHTLRTVCIDFVGWYAGEMGIDIMSSIPAKARDPKVDGFFALEQTLKKCGKPHAWVSAKKGGRPKCGDILRHNPAFHVDVALGYQASAGGSIEYEKYVPNGVLVRVAGGQSSHPRPTEDVSKEFDAIKVVSGKGPYNPSASNLEGWLDLERFFNGPPAPTPPWLAGWWKVTWRGAAYYYYFFGDGTVKYTQDQRHPNPPPITADDTGDFTVDGNKISITWSSTGSEEIFTRDPPRDGQMDGSWNNREKLSASKQ
jgi:hypothetical protein